MVNQAIKRITQLIKETAERGGNQDAVVNLLPEEHKHRKEIQEGLSIDHEYSSTNGSNTELYIKLY